MEYKYRIVIHRILTNLKMPKSSQPEFSGSFYECLNLVSFSKEFYIDFAPITTSIQIEITVTPKHKYRLLYWQTDIYKGSSFSTWRHSASLNLKESNELINYIRITMFNSYCK